MATRGFLFATIFPSLKMALRREQSDGTGARRMGLVLWDMFTGSAPYRDIFFRTLDPRFAGGFAAGIARAALARVDRHGSPANGLDRMGAGEATGETACRPRRSDNEEAGMDTGALGREYADGEVLCRQGEPADRMFVVQSGRVEVVCDEGGREVRLGELGPGDVSGHMAIVDKQPRSAPPSAAACPPGALSRLPLLPMSAAHRRRHGRQESPSCLTRCAPRNYLLEE